MSESGKQTGSCLCGKVTFTIAEPVDEVGACHCNTCRRWTGGPLLAIHCKGPVAFRGEEHIVRYKSSEWAERGFCGTCGTHLFYFFAPAGEYIMSPGALDDQSGLTFTSQVFIDEKPDWYAFANETKNMTGPEVIAMYSPEDGDPA